MGFPGSSTGKESACDAGDPGLVPGLGRSSGEEIGYPFHYSWASLVAQTAKNLLQCGRPGFDSWVGKIPWRRARQPTPVFFPGESHRQGEPGGLQSMGSQRVRYDWVTQHSTWDEQVSWESFVFSSTDAEGDQKWKKLVLISYEWSDNQVNKFKN